VRSRRVVKEESGGDRAPRMLEKIGRRVWYYMPSAIAIAVLVLIWHYSVVIFELKEFILPTPGAAVATPFDPNYRWPENLAVTFYAVAGAFFLSAVLGIALGAVIVSHPLLKAPS
jgi:NitT/TauT family transport system permease protein